MDSRKAKLRGCSLLVLVGLLFGLTVPLSRLAAEIEAHPIGLTLWVNVIVGVFCIGIALCQRSLPRLDRKMLRFVFVWGLLGAVLGEVTLFTVAQHLPATTVSVIIVCEGFVVYGIVSLRRRGQVSSRSLLGLALGMTGMVILAGGSGSFAVLGEPAWVLIAFILPVVFALEDILLADALPTGLDVVAGTGLAAFAGSLLLLPIAWYTQDFVALTVFPTRLEIAIVGIAASTAVGTVLMVHLMTTTGAVFGSQTGSMSTIAGIAWSIFLLGEQLTAAIVLALAFFATGLLLVESRQTMPALALRADMEFPPH